jgi:hypothetical protein
LPFFCLLFALSTLGVAIKAQQVFPPQRKIWKHKNTKTYFSRQKKSWKVLDPIHRHKMQKHNSFSHTFHAKIKQGQLQKGIASSANPKKEHHHGGAICLV